MEPEIILEYLHEKYEWLNIQQDLEPELSSNSRKRTRSIMDSLFSSSKTHLTTKKDELSIYNKLPEF